jgi:hypothetical protein
MNDKYNSSSLLVHGYWALAGFGIMCERYFLKKCHHISGYTNKYKNTVRTGKGNTVYSK